MISKEQFRNGMSKFVTGVTIITTLDHQNNLHGMTANSFTSVSLSPPLILVCVDLRNNTHRLIESRRAFGVSILSDEQNAAGSYFALRPEDRKAKIPGNHKLSISGLPIIDGCLAFFGCAVIDSHIHGDHTIYVAEVKDLVVRDNGNPLIYYQSHFDSLSK